MKKLLKKTIIAAIISALILSIPYSAYAITRDIRDTTFDVSEILSLDEGQGGEYFKSKNPIVSAILSIIEFATIIIGSIAMIIIIVGGFQLMIAEGNQQKVDEGKETIKFAIIGLIITFAAYMIVIFVQSLFITSDIAPPIQ